MRKPKIKFNNLSHDFTFSFKNKKRLFQNIKSFFKNPLALVFSIILISLVLLSLIYPLVSPYSATKKIVDTSNIYIANLPSYLNPIVSRIFTQSQLDQLNVNFFIPIKIEPTAVLDEFLVTYNPYQLLEAITGQNYQNLFGTNANGVDILTRSLAASWNSILIAFICLIIMSFIGIFTGIILGKNVGNWVDTIFTRFVDIIESLPQIIWAFLLSMLIGVNNYSLILIICIVGVNKIICNSRIFTITLMQSDFINNSKIIGSSNFYIITKQILPVVFQKNIYLIFDSIGDSIQIIAFLSIFGFFNNPDELNLGLTIKEQGENILVNPIAFIPSILIIFTLLFSLKIISVSIQKMLINKK